MEAIFLATKHGDRPKGKKKRLYHIWLSMRERCNNPNHRGYSDYGGRGITVCRDWDDYSVFREWAMAHGYAEHLTIDRVDNSKGYTPENCRWATRKEQANNRCSNRILTVDGESHNVQWWVEKTGLPRSVVDNRLRRGWDDRRVVTTPLLTKGGKIRES
jgi:hypothetical protein